MSGTINPNPEGHMNIMSSFFHTTGLILAVDPVLDITRPYSVDARLTY